MQRVGDKIEETYKIHTVAAKNKGTLADSTCKLPLNLYHKECEANHRAKMEMSTESSS